jgi:hypothetical protein
MLVIVHITHFCAVILEQSMGARNRVRIGLSYWAAIGWRNRFLGSIKVKKYTVSALFKKSDIQRHIEPQERRWECCP